MRRRVWLWGSGERSVAGGGDVTATSSPCPCAPPLRGWAFEGGEGVWFRGSVEGTGCCRAAVAAAGSGRDVMGALRGRPG